MKLFPETLEGYCKHISVKKKKKIHPVLDYYSFFTCSNILQNTYKKNIILGINMLHYTLNGIKHKTCY